MKEKNLKLKLLKKEIKQIKLVINAFSYKYFAPPETIEDDEALEAFEEFRRETLFKLTDQWKLMELELLEMCGRVDVKRRTTSLVRHEDGDDEQEQAE